MDWFTELRELLIWGLPLITGSTLVYIINRIKAVLELSDREAWVATVFLSILMGLLTLIAEGLLSPGTLTVANIAETIILVFGSAQVWYFKIAAPRAGRQMADVSQILPPESD